MRTYDKFLQTWGPKIPVKIKVFLWFLYLERLITKVYRSRWAPLDATDCTLCMAAPETVTHLFCTCQVVREFWAQVGRTTGLQTSFQTLDELWAVGKAMKRADDNSLVAVISQSIVPVGAWTIWRMRNDTVFNGVRVYQENMWEMFSGCMWEWGRYIAKANEVHFREGALQIVG
ncbi:hypothetical protein QJS04_geneDACA021402 [Acorus gramineus]|uniref:Reverse transcriptase zinc-binding domain-containing protein n=1 Tax=Acorus gramineus TaxID=55184 RepID=A0AAV9A612_ACOGR|nr:hypothetical protein QJS04_geneDACA021402 [Acorus gramineus]